MKKKSYQKSPGLRLERAILAGLAAGLVASVAGGQSASAQTLSEYQEALKANAVLSAESGSSVVTDVASLDKNATQQTRAAGEGGVILVMHDKDVLNTPVEFRTSNKVFDSETGKATILGGDSHEGGETTLVFAPVNLNTEEYGETSAVADLRNAKFVSDGGGPKLYNGTVIAKPENIYGGSVENRGDYPDGVFEVGNETYDSEYRSGVTATLRLDGGKDNKFNGDWTNEAGENIQGSRFIKINDSGVLAADSALIFNTGASAGSSAGGMRSDAKNAIDFAGGSLYLTDDSAEGNGSYLESAGDSFTDKTVTVFMNTPKGLSRYLSLGSSEWGPVDSFTGAWEEKLTERHYTMQELNDSNTVKLRVSGTSSVGKQAPWATVSLKNGEKADVITIQATRNGYINTSSPEITFYFGDDVDWTNTTKDTLSSKLNETASTADLTNVKLNADHGIITLLNGTVKEKAENLFATGGTNEAGAKADGIINIGDGSSAWKPTLSLTGDSFNTASKEESTGTTANTQYIAVNKGGTLKLDSSLLFTQGQNDIGTQTDPGALTDAAKNAIQFNGGKLVITDPFANADYVAKAKQLLSDASLNADFSASGTTEVPTFDAISTITQDDTAHVAKGVTITDDGTHASTVAHALDRQSFNLEKSTNADYAITFDKDITIGYGTDITNADGNTVQYVTVDGNAAKKSGTAVTLAVKDLTINGNAQSGDGELYATVTPNGDSTTVNVKGANTTQSVKALDLKSSDTITVNVDKDVRLALGEAKLADSAALHLKGDGVMTDTKITLSGSNAKIQIDGTANNVTLDSASQTGGIVYVGSDGKTDSAAGELSLASGSDLKGLEFFLDPAWSGNDEIAGASKLAVDQTNVNATYTVGQNSILSFGTQDYTKAQTLFDQSRLSWGRDDITAALFLNDTITVDQVNGGILVDGAIDSAAFDSGNGTKATTGTVSFGKNSLLLVNAANLDNGTTAADAAIKGSSDVTKTKLDVADSSKLVLGGLKEGVTYTIADTNTVDASAATEANDSNWYNKPVADANVYSADRSLILDADKSSENTYVFKANESVVNRLNPVAKKLTSWLSTSEGATYLAALNDTKYAEVVNDISEAPISSGSVYSGVRAGMAAAERASGHLAMRNDPEMMRSAHIAAAPLPKASQAGAAKQEKRSTSGIWAEYGYTKFDLAGQHGGADGDGHLNTITVGADFGGNVVQGGIAAMYGTGSSGTDNVTADNKVGGVSLYGRYRQGDYNLVADLGVYVSKSDISFHALPSWKPSAASGLVTVGLDNEYMIRSGEDVFVPHLGLRYNYVRAASFDPENGNFPIGYYTDSANFFTMPIGVAYHRDFQAQGGWKYGIDADLGVELTLGNPTTQMHVEGITGLDDSLDVDIYDKNAFYGKLGFTATSDRLDYGIQYQYRHSSDTDSHSIMAGLNFKF